MQLWLYPFHHKIPLASSNDKQDSSPPIRWQCQEIEYMVNTSQIELLWVERWSRWVLGPTWLTDGGMVANESRSLSFLQVKLLTPIDFARPSFLHSSICFQTPVKLNALIRSLVYGVSQSPGFTLMGQWIK